MSNGKKTKPDPDPEPERKQDPETKPETDLLKKHYPGHQQG